MERQLDQWDLVIKVKYGDTLRRIGAYVHGKLMDHNMSKLRAKIVSLFKFRDDADLILTYTDEDDDIVTLDDDDELRDAVIGQRLNPLRINVQLKSTDSTDARTQTSLPDNSPQSGTLPAVGEQLKSVPEPLVGVLSNLVGIVQKAVPCSPGITQKLDEVMKSEPFRSAMANLSKDVQKTTSFLPALVQVVEQVSSLGLSNAIQTSGPIGESSGGSSGASIHQVDLNVTDEPKASKAPVLETTELQSNAASSVNPVPKQNSSCDMVQGAGDAAPSNVDLNADAPRDATGSLYPFDDVMSSIWMANKYSEHEKEAGSSNLVGKSVAATAPIFPPAKQTSHGSENFWNPGRLQPYPSYMDGSADIMGGGCGTKQSPIMEHVSSLPQVGFNSHSEVPVRWPIGAPPSDFRFMLSQVMMPHPYQRSHFYNETTPRTFHRGVQCDGCGMHPIVGPRFKSNVKDDYDLCNICFAQIGNETDYTRIDHAHHRAPGPFKEYHIPHSRHRANVLHGSVRQHRGKLESHFIQDVTVVDGTMMPPSAHFTKIWRLRNNGTVPWPFGSQLVWVGGDKFGDRVSADLEIPANGFPVDKELDIAIDFTAPSRPGRYVSYWRMASPAFQKFGQRVWVLIQVEYSRPSSAAGGNFHPDLNLNLPPENGARNGSGIIDVNAEPLDSDVAETNITGLAGTTEELVRSVVEGVPSGFVEHPAQMLGDLLDASNAELSQSPPATIVPSTSYPLIDLQAMPSMVDAASVAAATTDSNTLERTLLKELEDMGFKQIDLNKEVLRLNEYDLEQSVDDLCGFADWDPLVSELYEMGFHDKELNKKVLIKNGGSIKRAVLDLISGKMSE